MGDNKEVHFRDFQTSLLKHDMEMTVLRLFQVISGFFKKDFPQQLELSVIKVYTNLYVRS